MSRSSRALKALKHSTGMTCAGRRYWGFLENTFRTRFFTFLGSVSSEGRRLQAFILRLHFVAWSSGFTAQKKLRLLEVRLILSRIPSPKVASRDLGLEFSSKKPSLHEACERV